MKNVTLDVDRDQAKEARLQASAHKVTLNEEFRGWIEDYDRSDHRSQSERALEVIERIRSYARSGGRKFTREEMNE